MEKVFGTRMKEIIQCSVWASFPFTIFVYKGPRGFSLHLQRLLLHFQKFQNSNNILWTFYCWTVKKVKKDSLLLKKILQLSKSGKNFNFRNPWCTAFEIRWVIKRNSNSVLFVDRHCKLV